jgi:uncharacterized hydrophobic protein (TIGR00271 family)
VSGVVVRIDAGYRVLQIRIYGDTAVATAAAEALDVLAGARHVTFSPARRAGTAAVTADVKPEAADQALAMLNRLGVSAGDVALVRLETIGPHAAEEPLALVWSDVLSQAHVRARAPGRYFILMAAAGVIAGLAVINKNSVLLVGAMAISPDLLPITAACTGIVLRRRRLVRRGIGTLALGLATTWLLALAVGAFFEVGDLLPEQFSIGRIPASETHVNATTILVALAAGVAGMLAVETRASAAVGVAISVTTIPAAAYLGAATGTGQLDHAWSGLSVLVANIAMMLAGGSVALASQRFAARRARRM